MAELRICRQVFIHTGNFQIGFIIKRDDLVDRVFVVNIAFEVEAERIMD
jgi:hypothetical protein